MIDLKNNDIFNYDESFSKKHKKLIVKSSSKRFRTTKYDIVFIPQGSNEIKRVDPDIKVCDPKPCKPSN